jgi:membrane protease YdiL (CAAX protease family)
MTSLSLEAPGRLSPALRVALYLLAIAIAAGGLETLAALAWQFLVGVSALPLLVSLPAEASGGRLLRRGAFVAGVLLVTYVFRRALDRRSLTSLGLQRGPGWVHESLVGLALGAALMMLVLGAELGLGAYRVRAFAWQERSFDSIVGALGLSLVGFAVVAFYEELVARGYILQNLAAAWGRRAGLIVSSAIFALAHLLNPGAGLVSSIGLFFAGLLLAGGYLASGRLWLPMGLHLSWNFFQGPVFGFPVSGLRTTGLISLESFGPDLLTGSTFGPEASAVGVAVSLLGLAFLWRWAWVKGQGRRVQD